MKYIKIYENSFDKIKILSTSITNFLNNIEPELECYVKKNNNNNIWIISKDNQKLAWFGDYNHDDYNHSIVVIMFHNPELIKFFEKFIWYNVEIRHNCHQYYNGQDIGTDGKGTSIMIPLKYYDMLLNNLTKENYDQYLLELNVNKYNI